MKVMTLVGTRPEIIRLSRIIDLLDSTLDHVVVLTGQNPDPLLSSVFIEELGLRQPDHNLHVDVTSLGSVIAGVIAGVEQLILLERPDAFLVLGDTNSCLGAIMARRMGIPVFHHEAGNRCFDERVPEETNRRIIDHFADFNLCYTEHALRNLQSEGLPGKETVVVGSPLLEVLQHYRPLIEESMSIERLDLTPGNYLLASIHRAENVDDASNLQQILSSLLIVKDHFGQRMIVSAHPRLRRRLSEFSKEIQRDSSLEFLDPFGYFDYMKLQMNATCVLSDSGSISEESAMAQFPAVTVRESIERPEAIETGSIVVTGLDPQAVLRSAIDMTTRYSLGDIPPTPEWYQVKNCAERTVSFMKEKLEGLHV
jgi:UDP-N-acetylglucosamine 2-epimerase (non-hydrolysing)